MIGVSRHDEDGLLPSSGSGKMGASTQVAGRRANAPGRGNEGMIFDAP